MAPVKENFENLNMSQIIVETESCCICASEEFRKMREKYGLEISIHEDTSSDQYLSFIKTFSAVLQISEATITSIIREKCAEQEFKHLVSLEYGKNFVDFTNMNHQVLNLAWIGCLAQETETDIMVICDHFCLNASHLGQNLVFFRSNHLGVSENLVAVTLTDMNVYHPLVINQAVRDNASNLGIKIIMYGILEASADESIQSRRPTDAARNVEYVDENMSTQVVEDIGSLAEEQLMSDDVIMHVAESSITLDGLFEHHFPNSRSGDINQNSYTSMSRLNLSESQHLDETLSYTRTFDNDGLFGVFDIEDFHKIIISSVKFFNFPTVVDERTLKNMAKMVPTLEGSALHGIKIGRIETPVGTIDLIVKIDSFGNFNDSCLKKIAELCAEYARTLPCSTTEGHSVVCRSGSIRNSHLSTMRATTEHHNRNELESYTNTMAQCYMYHFKRHLEVQLSRRIVTRGRIQLFFKCIGNKNMTFKDDLRSCFNTIKQFEQVINFMAIDSRNVWFDFCVTTSASSDSSQVNLKNFKLYLFLTSFFLDCPFLEW